MKQKTKPSGRFDEELRMYEQAIHQIIAGKAITNDWLGSQFADSFYPIQSQKETDRIVLIPVYVDIEGNVAVGYDSIEGYYQVKADRLTKASQEQKLEDVRGQGISYGMPVVIRKENLERLLKGDSRAFSALEVLAEKAGREK